MFVFSSRIQIRLHISFSLKDKRQVIHSLKNKFKSSFKVPLVEVGEQNNKNFSILAFTFVCEEISYGEKLQSKMLDYIEDNCLEEVVDIEKFLEKY